MKVTCVVACRRHARWVVGYVIFNIDDVPQAPSAKIHTRYIESADSARSAGDLCLMSDV